MAQASEHDTLESTAKCTFCGSDTQLYYNGVPVCLKCEQERYPNETSPPANRNKPPEKPSDSAVKEL
jgi:hypothetical protein